MAWARGGLEAQEDGGPDDIVFSEDAALLLPAQGSGRRGGEGRARQVSRRLRLEACGHPGWHCRLAQAAGVATLVGSAGLGCVPQWEVWRHHRGPGVVSEYEALQRHHAEADHASPSHPSAGPTRRAFKCGPAAAHPPRPSGNSTVWGCGGGECIWEASRCDGSADCHNGADERDCETRPIRVLPVVAAAASQPQAPASEDRARAAPSHHQGPGPRLPPWLTPSLEGPAARKPAVEPLEHVLSAERSAFLASSNATAGGAGLAHTAPAGPCIESGRYDYRLDWRAEGATFWEDWNFLQTDPNHGATQYLDRVDALHYRVIEALPTHAVLRAGPTGRYLKRMSAKLETARRWKYFLAAIRYEHVPWGCGVWPGIWTHAPDAVGAGGEFDLLEYANELPSRTALRVNGTAGRCRLDPALLNRPGCTSMPDVKRNFAGDYDCASSAGCAPNDPRRMLNGEDLAREPGVLALEWTPEYAKVFRIPAAELPQDLAAERPHPEGWDRWLLSYYPFAASERGRPGTCPRPAELLQAQSLVIGLSFCGEWASKAWPLSSCANRGQPQAGPWSARGPKLGVQCSSDPALGTLGDCCAAFVFDVTGHYESGPYLESRAFFNLSWVKVFQASELAVQAGL